MKNKILAILLSFTLIFTTTGFSFADDDVAPAPEPEKKSEQVVEKKVEAPAVKEEVKVEKKEAPAPEPAPVVKEEPKVQEVEKAEAEKVKVEAEKAEVTKEKAPPKELGPPPEEATHEVVQMEMEDNNDAEKKWPLKLVFTYENTKHEKTQFTVDNLWENKSYTAIVPKDSMDGFDHWKLTEATCGNAPKSVDAGYTFKGMTEKPQRVWKYTAVYKSEDVEKEQTLVFCSNDGTRRAEIPVKVVVGESHTCVVPHLCPPGKHFAYWEAKDTGEKYYAGDKIVATEKPDTRYFEAIYEDDVETQTVVLQFQVLKNKNGEAVWVNGGGSSSVTIHKGETGSKTYTVNAADKVDVIVGSTTYEYLATFGNGKYDATSGKIKLDRQTVFNEYKQDGVEEVHVVVKADYKEVKIPTFTFICTDEVSTGSGSWHSDGGATTFSHTFTNPLDKTPVEGYEFLYWENVNDSKEKYKAGETYTCDLTKLKEDTTVEFVAVYTQIYTLKINDAEKLYGADDPKFTAEWNGPFKIQWKYSREPGENVGEYKITAKITGMDEPAVKKTSNYKIVVEDGLLRIYPRTVWVDIDDFSKEYGDEDPDFGTAKVTSDDSDGFKVPYPDLRYAVGRVVEGEDVDVYKDALTLVDYKGEEIEVMTLNNQNPNYVFKINRGDFEITPKVIEGVLTIHDKTKVYGEEDPEFTYTWDGEFKIPKPTLFRQEGENVGDYRIMAEINGVVYNTEPTVKPMVKKLEAETKVPAAEKIELEKKSNYEYKITVIDGNLEITPREITIAAVYKFKMLEDVTDEEDFDATVTGLLEQDEEWFEEEVCWDVDCDYDIAVGDYPIVITAEWEPDIFVIDDPVFPWPGEFEEWPMEMKKVEDVPMVAAKSVGLKKNSTIVAGNYTIKTVDNVFQIRDKEVPPVDPDDPDTPVVNPDNNGGNNGDVAGKTDKNTKQGVVRDKAVKTGDNAFLMMNALLLMAALATTLILILTRRRREDDEE